MTPSDGDDPAVSLEWQHQRPAAGPPRAREAEHTLPVAGGVVGNLEHSRRVGQVDAHRRLVGRYPTERAEGVERERPAAGGIDHQVGVDGRGLFIGAGIPHSLYRRAVRPVHEPLNAGALAQVDGGRFLEAPAYRQLDERPRHRVGVEAKITRRERVEARPLHPHIKPHAKPKRARARQTLLEPGKQLGQRALAAGEQSVNVAALRTPWRSRGSRGRTSRSSTSTRSKWSASARAEASPPAR